MALWLRADCGIIADSTGFVSSWSDVSGRANDLYWRTPTADDPTRIRGAKLVADGINGNPVVRFALTSDPRSKGSDPVGGCFESVNQAFLTGKGPYAIFLVTHPWPGGGSRVRDGAIGTRWAAGIVGWGDYNSQQTNSVAASSVLKDLSQPHL